MRRKKVVLINSLFPVLSETFLFDQFTKLLKLSPEFAIVANHKTELSQIHPHMTEIQKEVEYLVDAGKGEIAAAMIQAFLSRPLTLLRCLTVGLFESEENKMTTLAHIVGACLVRKKQPDVKWLHAHFTYGAASIAFWSNKLFGTPYSLTLHGADVNFDNPPNLNKKLENAAHIFSISQFNIDYMHSHFAGTQGIPTSVIPLGVDLSKTDLHQSLNKIDKEIQEHQKASQPLQILNVGRLSEHKAQHLLIEACEKLKKAHVEFVCHIIGEGPKRPYLEQQIAKAGLSDNVILYGLRYHDEVLAFYQKVDIFVMSSITEGMPLVIMESMQRGVPVIAPSVSGIPEMIDDGIDGFLYPVADTTAMFEKIRYCVSNKQKLEDVSNAAIERVKRQFDLDKNSAEFGKYLLRLAGISGES